jgi:hypothetical protein
MNIDERPGESSSHFLQYGVRIVKTTKIREGLSA